MSVAILLVTHEHIGRDLLAVAGRVLNEVVSNMDCVEVPMDTDTEEAKNDIQQALDRLSTSEGILILTDSYGSTPCNVASKFVNDRTMLVSGVNLPMIIRLMNYRTLDLEEIKEAAVIGGMQGIASKK